MSGEQGFHLSTQQRQIWVAEDRRYSRLLRVRLDGPLEASRLRRSFEHVVARHEVLRTAFRRPTGLTMPFQVLESRAEMVWQSIDGTLGADAEQTLVRLVESELNREFPLEGGPCLRVSCVRLCPELHCLVLSAPALVADLGTLELVLQEARDHYAGRAAEPRVGPLAYLDYCEWQLELLESDDEASNAARLFWRRALEPSEPRLQLPWRKAANTSLGERRPRRYLLDASKELALAIREAAERTDVSRSALLLAAWQLVLGRLCAIQRVRIAVAGSGRTDDELGETLGPLAVRLPVVFTVDPIASSQQAAARSAQALRSAFDVQEYYQPPEDRQVLPRIGYGFDSLPATTEGGGLLWAVEAREAAAPDLELSLNCVAGPESLRLCFDYDPEVYDLADVERLAGTLSTLVRGIAADPATSVSELSLLSTTDRRWLLYELNPSRQDQGLDVCIHQLFEECAASSPEAVAAADEHRELTYAELNQKANRLARLLRDRGIGPEARVAVLAERTAYMPIAMLGVLKAGGAYVPLDPQLPPARMLQMVSSAEARVLLCPRHLEAQLPQCALEIVLLEQAFDLEPDATEDAPATDILPDNLAYVLFTSGSTGAPKPVGVEHRQLVNYTRGIISQLELPAEGCYATLSSFGVDLGHTAVFPSLCNRGKLLVVAAERAIDPDALGELFCRHPVDVLKCTPTHLSHLLESSRPDRLLPRQTLILGGEELSWSLVERVKELAPGCAIFNHYGPTEATVGVLTHAVGTSSERHRPRAVPLGRPLANTQAFVLDRSLAPVAVGVTGDLYVAGQCLSRGYLDSPELTKERFIPRPVWEPAWERSTDTDRRLGALMYRTGDLARRLPSGLIEFSGRSDDQVKIRGFRVELGEIESVLCSLAPVRQCAVVLRSAGRGGARLVGYLVGEGAVMSREPGSDQRIQSALREFLPDYMIPSELVWLKRLPLTEGGKIDRQALPEPKKSLPSTYVAARSKTEKTVADIWREILGVDRIGVEHDFFDLGGHSLLATQIISRCRATFEIELPVAAMFEGPTISAMAERIEARLLVRQVLESTSASLDDSVGEQGEI